jgi:coproporphyrinogen III oxidase
VSESTSSPVNASLAQRAELVVREIQDAICAGLEAVEQDLGSSARFGRDAWTRPDGGGGVSRVLEGGAALEKGGVNVSSVYGTLSEDFAAMLPGSGRDFFATGVSLVLHPRNPNAATVHANFRYLEHGERCWFGGGADLTPSYYFEDDAAHFHATWEACCRAHPGVADYERFRAWCDRYFYLPHRGEHRGVGGIFFDYLWANEPARAEALLDFVRAAGASFLPAYEPLLRRRATEPYHEPQREWQLLRRGRYAEFNLVYDRGTVFGLRTGGRVESILMSLPPLAAWAYAREPAPGTPEARLLEVLRRPVPPGDDPG